jgi:hypothetical protein
LKAKPRNVINLTLDHKNVLHYFRIGFNPIEIFTPPPHCAPLDEGKLSPFLF